MLKYTLNLVRCFLLHSTKFQYFFYGFKSQLSNSYDNYYVQKYLKGIFHKGILLIWKEYFTHGILSFSSLRYAIIARQNVIYTKFRCAMIAQLNKIWRVWACVCVRLHATYDQAWYWRIKMSFKMLRNCFKFSCYQESALLQVFQNLYKIVIEAFILVNRTSHERPVSSSVFNAFFDNQLKRYVIFNIWHKIEIGLNSHSFQKRA